VPDTSAKIMAYRALPAGRHVVRVC